MLEAFYDKTCLAKCSGNCLHMHFEYQHVSVAQKLAELSIFWCHQLLIAVVHIGIAETQLWRPFMIKLVYQNVLEILWRSILST